MAVYPILFHVFLQLFIMSCGNCKETPNIGCMNVVEFQNPHHFNCSVTNSMAEDSLDKRTLTVFYMQFQESMTFPSFTLIFRGGNYSCIDDGFQALPCKLHGINSATGENKDTDSASYANFVCQKMHVVGSDGSAGTDGANDECVHHSRKGKSSLEDELGETCAINKVYMYGDYSNFGCYNCCKGSWYDYQETKSCMNCSSKYTTPGTGVYPSCSVKIELLSTVATPATPTTPTTPSTTPTRSTTRPKLFKTSSTSTTTTTSLPPTRATKATTSTSPSLKSSTSQQETSPSTDKPKSSNNTGIAIAVIVVIVAVALTAYCIWKRYCKGRNSRPETGAQAAQDGTQIPMLGSGDNTEDNL